MKNKYIVAAITWGIISTFMMLMFCGAAIPEKNIEETIGMPSVSGIGRKHCQLESADTASVAVCIANVENVPDKEKLTETTETAESIGNPNSAVYQAWENLDGTTKQYFFDAADEFDVDVNMIAAIAYNETRYTASATNVNTNGTTDWGMTQCNDVTFDIINSYIGISSMSELLDAQTGIRGGCSLLRYYADTYGLSGTNLLLAYQEGYGNYQKVMRGEAQPWQAYYNVCQYMNDLCL